MKKLLLLSLVLFISACESPSVAPEPLPVEQDGAAAAEEVVIPEGWVEFRDEEIGVSFWGPNQVPRNEKEEGWEAGEIKEFGVNGFNLIATTSNYDMAPQGGCCSYYSGAALDLSKSDEELMEILNNRNFKTHEFKRITVDGKPAVQFITDIGFLGSNLIPVVIAPYEENGFANLMIKGPSIFEYSGTGEQGDYELSKVAVSDFFSNEYKSPPSSTQVENFENIISTIDFFESDYVAYQGSTLKEPPKEEPKHATDVYVHQDTLTIHDFTFDIPENWFIGSALDENTYHMKLEDTDGELYYFNFALQPLGGDHFKSTPGLNGTPATNTAGTFDISQEGVPSPGPLRFCYGIWEGAFMNFFTIQENDEGDFPPDSHNDILSSEIVEAVLVSVR